MSLPELFANRPQPIARQTLVELAASFGIDGVLRLLPSERDQNVLIVREDGSKFLLKVKNPADHPEAADFETQVLLQLEAGSPDLVVPRVVRTLRGEAVVRLDTHDGQRSVRMQTYVAGTPVAGLTASRRLRESVGDILGVLSRALGSIELRPPACDMPWDLRQFLSLRELLAESADDTLREHAQRLFERWEHSGIADDSGWNATGRSAQLLHNDFNPHNLLVSDADMHRVSGVIDFGDVAYGPAIVDLAVASAYWIGEPEPLEAIADVAKGFHQHRPLTTDDLVLLPMLIEARLLVTVLVTRWRANRNPQNRSYILRNEPTARAGLATLGLLPHELLRAHLGRRLEIEIPK